jgi:ankyrin repeat protein
MLLSRNASVDQRGDMGISPLHIAAQCGHIDTVTALLKNNASASLIDDNGRFTLHRCISSNCSSINIVRKLLLGGAEVNRKDDFGHTPLTWVTRLINSKDNDDVSDTSLINLNILAFELIQNNASMTKLDVAVLSKFAIQNSRMLDNSYLETLWGSPELRNRRNIKELRNFDVTNADKEYLQVMITSVNMIFMGKTKEI